MMYDKPVQTYVGTADKAVTDEPTLLYWIAVEPSAVDTLAIVTIRDGFSTSDKAIARLGTPAGELFPFYPPLRCAAGLYVDVISGLAYYTVGYLFERIVKEQG